MTLSLPFVILQLITSSLAYHIVITAPSVSYGHWNELNHVAKEILSRTVDGSNPSHFITFIIDENKDKYLNAIRETYGHTPTQYQIIYIQKQHEIDPVAVRNAGILNPLSPLKHMMATELTSLISTTVPFLEYSTTGQTVSSNLESKMNQNLHLHNNNISCLIFNKKVDICLLDQANILMIALCDAYDIPIITNSASAVTAIKEYTNFWNTYVYLNYPMKLNSYPHLLNGTIMSYSQRLANIAQNVAFIVVNKLLSIFIMNPILQQLNKELIAYNRSLFAKNQQYKSGVLSVWDKTAMIESLGPPFASIEYVGPRVKRFGFLIYPPHKLKLDTHSDLIEWIESDNKSILLISFGSAVLFEQITMQNLYNGLVKHSKKNNYKIIWALRQNLYDNITNEKLQIPNNMKIMKWIPQIQLLLHPQIKLFLSHAGNNGVVESIYSKKLMVLVPNAADQHFNAKRVTELECGKIVEDTIGFTDLFGHISNLMLNEKSASYYQNKIDLLHKILSRTGGVKEAADFVEYVSEFGTRHLLCTLGDRYGCNQSIPWYQQTVIDVYVMVILILIMIIMIVRKYCCCCINSEYSNKQKIE